MGGLAGVRLVRRVARMTDGRSAYELARDRIEGDAATAVVCLLSLRPEFAGLQLVAGVAIDDDSRVPR
jgi:hypothetical protein